MDRQLRANDASQASNETASAFFHHSSAKRVNTDATIAKALRAEYPDLQLVVVPSLGIDLLGYASAGHASFTLIDQGSHEEAPSSLTWKVYRPPGRRIDHNPGSLVHEILFAKFLYKWQSAEFILYLVDGRDGTGFYPAARNHYLLTTDTAKADSLILAAGQWGSELHEEVWVWDSGMWRKSAELYQSIQKSSWDAVILDERMKKAIIADHQSFFDSRDTYARLKVPWKRGLIYHGPPGNGKTISIKAMMHTLYDRKDPVPTLYVRSFSSFAGPEYGISQIFLKARQFAPCYLIFEDLDSLVTDSVRSYFLNEIDGLQSNDGIFIVGSTNHLERLDPGIAKRPSRFDRKYYFPDPDMEQRIAYCRFWQRKLADNKDIEFPDKLCPAIAGITDGFSFAYIQEAFVAALIVIARDSNGLVALSPTHHDGLEDGWVGIPKFEDDDDLDGLVLWVEIKKQVAILREGMEEERARAQVRNELSFI
ncbi:P-loop containing nucleoside triphosphate hydrolase protein [Parathielavia appendiculata]|uniref:P-loop containing nucleoside triphosphate hydrolase protein n=1 Tax=Parathielavia appendiculata TaxID=2587402 RepID=A0AAN6YZK3_9PEZI|nr:P-loop containing nucleoside triphosphate hydrolase protein [Parathielavia appendiculata]